MAVDSKIINLVDSSLFKEIKKEKNAANQRELWGNLAKKNLENFKNKVPKVYCDDLFIPVSSTDEIKARLYTPFNCKHSNGIILFVHGGGWSIGDIETYHLVCMFLAKESKCKFLSVEYRLAPEFKFPTAVNDITAIMDWVFNNTEIFGINSNKIAIMGDSAGGNLSTVSCILRERENKKLPCAKILVYPATDKSKKYPSYNKYKEDKHHLTQEWSKWFYDNYKRTDEDLLNPLFSPMLFDKITNMPETLFIFAEEDPLIDEGFLYAKKLIENGNKVTIYSYPNMIHGFLNYINVVDESILAIKKIGKFIKEKFNEVDKLKK